LRETVEKGETWLSATWAVSEFYFYRRVMEAIGYFRGEYGDPFATQKHAGLATAGASMEVLAARVNASVAKGEAAAEVELSTFVMAALWGNRMDLSLWPASADDAGRQAALADVVDAGKAMLLDDSTPALERYVKGLSGDGGARRMDIIVDNAGFELFCDLCLADFLISSGLAGTVKIHLKGHPTYVSDALAKDVIHTIDYLASQPSSSPAAAELAARWRGHVASGRWDLSEHFFWAQPTAFWSMPSDIRSDLSANSALVFVKGDANYRRMLGDLAWDLSTPFDDIVCGFPAPVCALRALKAEVGCGMSGEIVAEMRAKDEQWLVNGKYGVIQFMNPRG